MSEFFDATDSLRSHDDIKREHARGYDDDIEYLDAAWLTTALIGVIVLAALLWWTGK